MSEPQFAIEKGVPIPKKNSGRPASRALATMRAMEIGDSFLLLDEGKGSSIPNYAKTAKIKITQRKTENPGEYRVWRIA